MQRQLKKRIYLLIIFCFFIGGCFSVEEQKKDKVIVDYEIVERKDISALGLEQITLKVLVSKAISGVQIEFLTEYLLEEEKTNILTEKTAYIDELTIWYYDDIDDISQSYTVAMAEYSRNKEEIKYYFTDN